MKSYLKLENIVDTLTLAICYYYLSSYFPKEFILLNTVVTGGDTASHYATVDYLKNNLFPKGKLIGWFHGNYGGFPLFIYYFPLLFVLAAFLGYIIPLTIALKLVTIIGPLLLPICSYAMLRLCNFRFPGPALGSVASILFLVNGSNSMWGGNLYSTFAGEFSYATSFSLSFLFLGLLYRIFKNINENPHKFPTRYTIFATLTFTAIGLTHGFTLIICVVSSLYFLITTKHFTKKVLHLVTIFGIGGSLFAFWFIPLFLNLPYTTQYHLKWIFNFGNAVEPAILITTTIIFIIQILLAIGIILIIDPCASVPKKIKHIVLSLFGIWFIVLGISTITTLSFQSIGQFASYLFFPLFFSLPDIKNIAPWFLNLPNEVAPNILIPTALLFILYSLFACIPKKFKFQVFSTDERAALPFIWFIILCCVVAYFLSSDGTLKVPDIRFIPFVQYLTAIWGAAFLSTIFNQRIIKLLLPLLCLKLALWGIEKNPSDAQYWAKWNYQGYENAPAWSIFKETNNFLKGNFADPRVAFEHHDINNTFGSTRAFENIPLFSRRSTLEGLYFQSSLLSPFVFYMQSLYSKMYSCPFPEYQCSNLNLERAYDYLKLFNVNQIISLTKEAKEQLKVQDQKYTHQQTILESAYEVWKLNEPSTYVEVLKQNPGYIEPLNFREVFYSWFKEYNKDSKFLYTKPEKFGFFYGLDKIPKLAPETDSFENIASCIIEERIEDETVSFKTNCPGKPHLVKFAYNPGWKAKGAVGPYLVSPAFMLVYPTEENVVLTYDNSFTEIIGEVITAIGVALLLLLSSKKFLRKKWL